MNFLRSLRNSSASSARNGCSGSGSFTSATKAWITAKISPQLSITFTSTFSTHLDLSLLPASNSPLRWWASTLDPSRRCSGGKFSSWSKSLAAWTDILQGMWFQSGMRLCCTADCPRKNNAIDESRNWISSPLDLLSFRYCGSFNSSRKMIFCNLLGTPSPTRSECFGHRLRCLWTIAVLKLWCQLIPGKIDKIIEIFQEFLNMGKRKVEKSRWLKMILRKTWHFCG